MRMIRTLIWIVITAVLVAFVAMNWEKAPVNIWPAGDGYYHLEWPVGLIAIAFFLLGLLPMWLLARLGKWRLTRRISVLESTVRSAVSPAPPIATSTQLEAQSSAQSNEGPQS